MMKLVQNRPAPNKEPILYEIPVVVSPETKAVITSPAPLATAKSVTAAKDSDNYNDSLNKIFYVIFVILLATYLSTVIYIV